ncbi:MAG: FG-GAP repeat domain-containing protein [Limisphaerales bacterium]
MKIIPNLPRPGLLRAIIAQACLCLGASADQFEDSTAAAGLSDSSAYCFASAWGDYDNDGFPDLFIAAGGASSRTNLLYRNLGNRRFIQVGAEAGPITTDRRGTFGSVWMDFNNDGHVDLLAINGPWSAERNELYWNHGDGTFSRGSAGPLTSLGESTSWPAGADYDGDGWLDLHLSAGTTRLFHATGQGTFTTVEIGPTLNSFNDGVWGDFDNDGDPDLFACNFTAPSSLWRNEGRGQFTRMTNGLPAAAGALHAAWADYDSDGDLDIAMGSFGGVAIYRNDANAGFVRATNYTGSLPLPAWADYDNDGHPDLLAVGGQGSPAKAARVRRATCPPSA